MCLSMSASLHLVVEAYDQLKELRWCCLLFACVWDFCYGLHTFVWKSLRDLFGCHLLKQPALECSVPASSVKIKQTFGWGVCFSHAGELCGWTMLCLASFFLGCCSPFPSHSPAILWLLLWVSTALSLSLSRKDCILSCTDSSPQLGHEEADPHLVSCPRVSCLI